MQDWRDKRDEKSFEVRNFLAFSAGLAPLHGAVEEGAKEEQMGRTKIVGLIGAALLWLGMASPSLAAETFKVAVMDQQMVIEQSKAGKRAVEELKSYSLARQKIVNADEQELKELQQAIQDGTLTDSAKQEKQAQLQAKVEAYQRRVADFRREVQQKQRDMVMEYSKKVQSAAQVVVEKNGFDAIIEKGSEAAMRIVLYHQPALDLTDQIVTEFDRQNK